MLEIGIIPIVSIFKENLSEEEAFKLERELIEYWGRRDIKTGILCNLTDGGEGNSGGTSNYSREYSFDTRIKLSHNCKLKGEALKRNRESNIKTTGRSICSVNPLTNKIIRIFDSIGRTKDFGFVPSNIQAVLNNPRRTSCGYFWRDCTLSEIKESRLEDATCQ
jgi:hypothetical protein